MGGGSKANYGSIGWCSPQQIRTSNKEQIELLMIVTYEESVDGEG